ncbi:MAG: glycosyltransferase [Ignavibacteria bacterium]|nr:glycosyltransferase [Ignavibacteria bacterium]
MKHIVAIRFDYKPSYYWLNERIDLFHKFTIKSLYNQTNKDFIFVIITNVAHRLDPVIFKDFDVVALNGNGGSIFNDAGMILKEYIRNNVEDNERVITSRLDNDDYYLPNYVNIIKLYGVNEGDFVVDLRGYWFDTRTNEYYTNKRYIELNVTSPFLSMYSTNDLYLKTCYDLSHDKMGSKHLTIKPFSDGWVQIIHKYNYKMARIKPGGLEGERVERIGGFVL